MAGYYNEQGVYVPTGAYADESAYKSAYGQLVNKYASRSDANWNRTTLAENSARQLSQAGEQFRSYFRQMVGRDPTANEASMFYNQQVSPNLNLLEDGKGIELSDSIKTFVNDNFQESARLQAMEELKGQQAEASRLAGLYREQGKQSISGVEERLMDYQNRLFERLRPQLLVSLQDQGLLNTGGLNEAMAGAQKDLASEASNYLSDQYLQNELAANQIEFGGQSAPYEYQRQMALGRVDNMNAAGTGALDRAFKTYSDNLAFDRQTKLMSLQAKLARDAQPGLLGRLGQNFVSNFGASAGQQLGKTMGDPNTYAKAFGG